MNTQDQKFLKVLETYVQNFPFEGTLFSYGYSQISQDPTLVGYRIFSKWLAENRKSAEVLNIFEKHKEKITELNRVNNEAWEKCINNAKLMFPMETEYLPLFDNGENENCFFMGLYDKHEDEHRFI